MTDKELIELAAKAAGVKLQWHHSGAMAFSGWDRGKFDPLNDDGDALRLAVSLGLIVGVDYEYSQTTVDYTSNHEDRYLIESHGMDAYAATRRAITRAAAKIGKEME